MPNNDTFDVLIIGGGPGGYACALRAAQLGLQVVCVDKRATPGGTCLNVGCIPSKALLDSSERFAEIKKLSRHGINVGDVNINLEKMMSRKTRIVDDLTKGIASLFRKNKVKFVQGTATLLAAGKASIAVEDGATKEIAAKSIVLATGSEPDSLKGISFDGEAIVSSTEALSFEEVPEHLIVVGAGYIGLELGSVWQRLGAKVTVLEFLPRILPLTDTEIAALAHKSLTKQGMNFHLDTRVTAVETRGGKVRVKAQTAGKDVAFDGDKVLLAVGRRPSIQNLGLEKARVEFDVKSGRIVVDKDFQTSLPSVFAIGDLIEGPMLAHKAQIEGETLAERLAGKHAEVNYDAIPSVVYIWPEVASVGLTEDQLQKAGRDYKVGKFPFLPLGRAKCLDESEGLVKLLSDKQSDRLLGVHIFGPRASDMIAEAVAVMEFFGSAEDLARICHAHPTLSEAVGEAARHAAFGAPLHA